MKKILIAMIISLIFPASLFSFGFNSSGGGSDKCNTKYPIVLAHGMGAQYEIAWGITHYWNDIPDELKSNGAKIYITSVDSLAGTAEKASDWRRQVLEILAVTGAEKVNIIGHSHGAIYSRYAISNLDYLSDKIASLTSIAGPHRGSYVAEVVLDIAKGNIIADIVDGLFGFLMGDTDTDIVTNLEDLTRDYMINTFNPNTPNMEGIYYQSYAYKIKTLIGANLFLPTWLIQIGEEGASDGLVSVTSAKWGNFRGVISGGVFGVNHLAAVDMLFGITPGFDAPAHFVDVVSDLKNMGY
jgi:triacylglycerol lipase